VTQELFFSLGVMLVVLVGVSAFLKFWLKKTFWQIVWEWLNALF